MVFIGFYDFPLGEEKRAMYTARLPCFVVRFPLGWSQKLQLIMRIEVWGSSFVDI